MNFLERRAMARAERDLAPVLSPGEHLLDFDIGTLDRNPRTRLHFAATDKALYIAEPAAGELARFPYERIAAVSWDPTNPFWRNRFFIHLTDGQQLHSTIKNPRNLPAIVKERVEACVLLEKHVARGRKGKGAVFQYRPLNEDGELYWRIKFDEGVNGDDPTVQEWAQQVIDDLRSEWEKGQSADRT